MSSTQRAASQIPRNGAYVTTGSLAGATFDATGAAVVVGITAVGTILTDMGKTVYLPATATNKAKVLRKVQLASTTGDGVAFYINIGGDNSLAAAPVARL